MKKKKGLIVDIIERERFGLEYVVVVVLQLEAIERGE
jgi:hypothetical protein